MGPALFSLVTNPIPAGSHFGWRQGQEPLSCWQFPLDPGLGVFTHRACVQAATSPVRFARAGLSIQKYFQAQFLKFCHYTFFERPWLECQC